MTLSSNFLHGLFLAGLAASLASACSSDVTPVVPVRDAGMVSVDMPVVRDTGTDTTPADTGHPAQPSMIYGPCLADSDCQSGLTCRTAIGDGLPGGQCNHDCTSDNDCVLQVTPSSAVDGYCQTPDPTTHRRLCARVCANGIDCERDGYTCYQINPGALNQTDICVSVCSDTTCGPGAVCDHQSGRCRDASASPPAGQHIGDPCIPTGQPGATASTQCLSGHCSPAAQYDSMMRPVYTGFNGGSCYGYCILPVGYNDSTFFHGTALPQADCPTGSVCFPNTTFTLGDLGVCIHSCMADSDCRPAEGYYCEKSFAVTATRSVHFATGICTRINCANPATPCPTGYMCQTTTTANGTSGRCIPM